MLTANRRERQNTRQGLRAIILTKMFARLLRPTCMVAFDSILMAWTSAMSMGAMGAEGVESES